MLHALLQFLYVYNESYAVACNKFIKILLFVKKNFRNFYSKMCIQCIVIILQLIIGLVLQKKSSSIVFCGNGFVRYGMQNQWDLERLSHNGSLGNVTLVFGRDHSCLQRSKAKRNSINLTPANKKTLKSLKSNADLHAVEMVT